MRLFLKPQCSLTCDYKLGAQGGVTLSTGSNRPRTLTVTIPELGVTLVKIVRRGKEGGVSMYACMHIQLISHKFFWGKLSLFFFGVCVCVWGGGTG